MHLRHLFSPRLRGSLLLGSLLVASSFSTLAAEDMLRKAVGKGALESARKRALAGYIAKP